MSVPRLLLVDLACPVSGRAGAVRSVATAWDEPDPALRRLGAASGEALAVAVLLARARAERELPFVLAVGDAVRRGLPTAARTTIAARAPLSGLFADGQVGGDLGRRLARIADAVVLEGRAPTRSVLVLEPDGRAELCPAPWASDASPAERITGALATLGPGAALVTGPAGDAGVAFANLASGSPTSFVGRGGLGAALAERNLAGVLVRAEPLEDAPNDARRAELVAALTRSPRLRARADGGTLELFHAFAARGDGVAEDGARVSNEARAAGRERHGCRGCPTPCGWTFETDAGARQGARFNAVHALGGALGLEHFDDTLELLARCDALGIDAREAGAVLELWVRAARSASPPRGDRAALLALLDDIATDDDAARGAEALAKKLGLDDAGPRARGQAVRVEGALAALLGQCASARGADPMRSASHVLLDAGDRSALAALLAPVELPTGADDAASPVGKGRLVAWTEALSAAVDATGFCAFSAGGLLADGVVDVDGLARWILPEHDARAREPGRRLLALGASIALAARELERHLGAPPDVDRPAWARAVLDQPGMLDEYRRARGLDGEGRARPEALALLGDVALLELGERALRAADGLAEDSDISIQEPMTASERRIGRVTLRAVGSLGDALAGLGQQAEPTIEHALPAPLAEVLAHVAELAPKSAPLVWRDGRAAALVYRAGRRLAADTLVHDGDRLDLVVAIGGG